MSIDKQKIIQTVRDALADELRALTGAAKAAREAATHEESKAEDHHDTRSVEAAYLAGAQADRVAELERLALVFRFFPVRDFAPEAVIEPGALVELETNETRAFYLIVPQGGGLVTRVEGQAVQMITPLSPMGEALLGRKRGDDVTIETRSGDREYAILSVR